jgi:beta-fructofuranosidase
MGLKLPDQWVWDFWFAQDGTDYHIFYLQAPQTLNNEHLRHWHVSIGHAVSKDLTDWEILPDALAPSYEENAWDNYTTWTGSIIQYASTWYMFYTGSNRAEDGKYQRIGLATSNDLINWQKHAGDPIIEPDPRWYETYDPEIWFDQAWRDPWIFEHDGIFHAYITARYKTGQKFARGVIAHAISPDLLNWQVQPPITEPGEFGYLEVPQLLEIEGRWYLFFSVSQNLYSETRRSRPGVKLVTGTHYYVADHPLGPFKFLTDEFLVGDDVGSLYSGKLIRNPKAEWVFMAFRGYGKDHQFTGEITDPLPINVLPDGRLSIVKRKPNQFE